MAAVEHSVPAVTKSCIFSVVTNACCPAWPAQGSLVACKALSETPCYISMSILYLSKRVVLRRGVLGSIATQVGLTFCPSFCFGVCFFFRQSALLDRW